MRDLYTSVAAGVLFPIQERLKRHSTVAARIDMERTQWLPLEQLRAMQLQRQPIDRAFG